MTAPQVGRDRLLVPAHVERGVVERHRKRAQRVRRARRRERAHDARIDAAAQVPADRHIRLEAQPYGRAQQLIECVERVRRLGRRLGVVERVVAPHRQATVLPAGAAAGLERADPSERGAGSARRPEREDFVQALRVERGLHFSGRQQGLHFGPEIQIAVALRVVQRQNAESVAREKQGPRAAVVDRERELAVEALQHPLAPLLVGVHQHFGIAPGAEQMPASLQLPAQHEVVEDLAVVDDEDAPVLVRHGLRPARQVDHAQSNVGEADPLIHVQPETVGAAVSDDARHPLQDLGGDAYGASASDPGDAAHQSGKPSPRTCRGPTASTASAAHTELSTPPLSATTIPPRRSVSPTCSRSAWAIRRASAAASRSNRSKIVVDTTPRPQGETGHRLAPHYECKVRALGVTGGVVAIAGHAASRQDLMSRQRHTPRRPLVWTCTRRIWHVGPGMRVLPRYAEGRPGEVRDSLASIDKARALVEYQPVVDFREGLRQTVATTGTTARRVGGARARSRGSPEPSAVSPTSPARASRAIHRG